MNHHQTLKKTGLLRRLAGSEEGSVFIMVACGAGMLLAGVTMSVEMSKFSREKSRFRNAVDQALLAAASSGKTLDQAKPYASEYFEANLPQDGARLINPKIVLNANAERTEWNATGTAKVPTAIAGALGIKTLTLEHTAKVEWDKTVKNEVVAIVDISGTMCAKFKRDEVGADGKIPLVPDPSCTKLKQMETALTKIVEQGVVGDPRTPIFKVGIVPFSYKVRLADNRGNYVDTVAPFLTSEEREAASDYPSNDPRTGDSKYFSDLSDADDGGGKLLSTYGLKTINSDAAKDGFVNHIKGISHSDNREFNRAAWKRSSLGTQMAALMLDPRYTPLFGNEKAAAFDAPRVRKVAILMTDSVNMGCCFTNWPEGNFKGNYIYSYSLDHKHLVGSGSTAGICKQMKEAGIEIFTVLLDVKESDANARGGEIIKAFETCASTPEDLKNVTGYVQHAHRIDINDSASLEAAYQVIAGSLSTLRLTY